METNSVWCAYTKHIYVNRRTVDSTTKQSVYKSDDQDQKADKLLDQRQKPDMKRLVCKTNDHFAHGKHTWNFLEATTSGRSWLSTGTGYPPINSTIVKTYLYCQYYDIELYCKLSLGGLLAL